MVTLLQANVINVFTPLFVFLLVLVSTYAILAKTKIFGDHSAINAIVAFVLAIAFAVSDIATRTIAYAAPWLVMLFVVVLFLNVMFMFLGADKDHSPMALKENYTLIFFVFFFIILVFVLSVGQVLKEKHEAAVAAGTPEQSIVVSFPAKLGATIQNPAILGILVVMFVAVFAIMLLSSK